MPAKNKDLLKFTEKNIIQEGATHGTNAQNMRGEVLLGSTTINKRTHPRFPFPSSSPSAVLVVRGAAAAAHRSRPSGQAADRSPPVSPD